jgi:hypothetical protein
MPTPLIPKAGLQPGRLQPSLQATSYLVWSSRKQYRTTGRKNLATLGSLGYDCSIPI